MSKPDKIQVHELLKQVYETGKMAITDKDALLYALGIGFNQDPLKEADFKFTNEFNSQFAGRSLSIVVFPTMSSCFLSTEVFKPFMDNPNFPVYGIHQILHAEQKLHMVEESFKVGQQYSIMIKFIDVFDKGKNAFTVARINIQRNTPQGKKLAAYIDRNIFIRGLGGFNFKGTGMSKPIPEAPKRAPDATLDARTFANQAFFYRLNGDSNPLHIDPNVAAMAGFQRPIIHGLATYGIAARAITEHYLKNETKFIQSLETRFIGHVFPGESLKIDTWKEGSIIYFLVRTVERNTKVVSGVMTMRPEAKL